MHIVGSYMTTAHVQVQHDQDEHASLVPISLWFSFLSVYTSTRCCRRWPCPAPPHAGKAAPPSPPLNTLRRIISTPSPARPRQTLACGLAWSPRPLPAPVLFPRPPPDCPGAGVRELWSALTCSSTPLSSIWFSCSPWFAPNPTVAPPPLQSRPMLVAAAVRWGFALIHLLDYCYSTLAGQHPLQPRRPPSTGRSFWWWIGGGVVTIWWCGAAVLCCAVVTTSSSTPAGRHPRLQPRRPLLAWTLYLTVSCYSLLSSIYVRCTASAIYLWWL
jgi:hypothetical protein